MLRAEPMAISLPLTGFPIPLLGLPSIQDISLSVPNSPDLFSANQSPRVPVPSVLFTMIVRVCLAFLVDHLTGTSSLIHTQRHTAGPEASSSVPAEEVSRMVWVEVPG